MPYSVKELRPNIQFKTSPISPSSSMVTFLGPLDSSNPPVTDRSGYPPVEQQVWLSGKGSLHSPPMFWILGPISVESGGLLETGLAGAGSPELPKALK